MAETSSPLFFNGGVRMAACGKQFFQNADRVADLYWIVNAFLGNTHAPFAKSLQHIGFRHAFQTFKLQIPNNRQFLDLEYHVDATPRAFFGQDSGGGLIEKAQCQNRLQVALNLLLR